jgi:tryptophan-rich sensory protein
LVETVFLWLSVLALMVFIWPISTTASLLLAPYLIWVAIAGVLNRAIVRLNGPFAGRTETGTI